MQTSDTGACLTSPSSALPHALAQPDQVLHRKRLTATDEPKERAAAHHLQRLNDAGADCLSSKAERPKQIDV